MGFRDIPYYIQVVQFYIVHSNIGNGGEIRGHAKPIGDPFFGFQKSDQSDDFA